MRIAIVSPFIASTADLDYYASQQLNLASGFERLGHQTRVFTMDRQNRGPRVDTVHVRGQDIEVQYLAERSTTLSRLNLPMMRGLSRHFETGEFDIVQVSDDINPTTLRMALMDTTAKLIIFHGINEYSRNPFKHIGMLVTDNLLGPLLRNRTDLVIAKTRAAEEFVRRKGFSRVETIPMGVDTVRFQPSLRQDNKEYLKLKGCRSHTYTAVYTGNLIPRRDIPTMIQAVARVVDRGVDLGLLICGSGPQRESLENLCVDLGLRGAVDFLDPIPNAEIPRLLSVGDMFVFMPEREIFGMVLLEALACGLPVISTPVPAAVDIKLDHPEADIRIVPFHQHDSLASAILEVVNRPQADESTTPVNRTVALHHDWDRIAGRFVESFEKLIGNGS